MILPVSLKLGVENASNEMTPNGTAVQSNQGRNFPQRVLVRSAMAPMIILKKAPKKATHKNNNTGS